MIRACALAELTPGVVRVCRLAPDELGRPQEALVLLDPDGAVRVFLNRCAHIPVPLDGGSRNFLTPDGKELICGTHGATYRLADGFCTAGPCRGESLRALRHRIDDEGWVVVESLAQPSAASESSENAGS